MHPLVSAIGITWRRNGAYAARLVADLTPEQWTAQPVPGRVLNHPAWIFSHLNVYAPICTAMLRGEPFSDPLDHPFGQKSEVVTTPGTYAAGRDLLAAFERHHAEAEAALLSADEGTFTRATPLERWRALHPSTGDMLVALMVKHESGHLGQLSAWRRAVGLGRVPM